MRPWYPGIAPALLLALPLVAQPTTRPDSSRGAPPSVVLLATARAAPALPAAAPSPARRSVEHSDLYYRRLAVHRWTSWTVVPLFVAQYVVGERMLDQRADRGQGEDDDGDYEGAHGALAGAVAGVFAVNTVTGAWNWWDDRHEPAGRTRRTAHAVAMTLAAAGFVATGIAADEIEDDARGDGGASTHRSLAIGSMSLATASTVMMWLWRD